MDDKVIKLQFPIERDKDTGGTLSEVRLKSRVVAGDLLVMDEVGGPIGQTMALVRKLCRLSQSEVERLDMADYQAIQKELTDFLPGSQSED